MFSHLKAEDFVNLMEGSELPARHKEHVDACPRCRATWESMQSVHGEISSLETDVPEPDWGQFRSSVRDELLSRSIQRQTAIRRWTGWTIRPVLAWALSLFMVIGITTVTVLWKAQHEQLAPGAPAIATSPFEPASDIIEAGPERSLFDDVVSLGDEQEEQFRQMLESAQKGTTVQQ